MYFNNSFHQHYLGKVTGGVLDYAISGAPKDLGQGVIGLYATNAQGILGSLVSAGTTQNVTLVQGSWHTVDQIGEGLAGYQVPLYSQTINWRNVTQYIKTTGYAAQNQVISIGWDQGTGATGLTFFCGQSYYLKIEGLGEPALTFLNKQIYNNLDAWGGCCGTDCTSGCTSTYVDAACIMLQWKDRITQNPYLPSFISPAVYIQDSPGSDAKTQVYSAYDTSIGVGDGTYVCNTADPTSVIASLQLTVAYVNTEFNDCTFAFTDRYIYEPLYLQASLVNQDADTCATNTTANTFVASDFVTQLVAPRKRVGGGEDIIRAFIDSNRYRQYTFPDNIWADSLRMREVENDVSFNVNRNGTYDQLCIVFNKERYSNHTASHNNDQYAIIIDVPTGTNISTLQTIITDSLTAVGSNVALLTL